MAGIDQSIHCIEQTINSASKPTCETHLQSDEMRKTKQIKSPDLIWSTVLTVYEKKQELLDSERPEPMTVVPM